MNEKVRKLYDAIDAIQKKCGHNETSIDDWETKRVSTFIFSITCKECNLSISKDPEETCMHCLGKVISAGQDNHGDTIHKCQNCQRTCR